MDDILVLAPTRWKLRQAVTVVNQVLASLRLHKHPDKTFIGRVDVSGPPGPRQCVARSVGAGSGDWAVCLVGSHQGTARLCHRLVERRQTGCILLYG
jgi:hypothetical protein